MGMDMEVEVVWEVCTEVVQTGERFLSGPNGTPLPFPAYLDKCFYIFSLRTNPFLNVLFCV